ncbi:MAG: hypothetical protein WCB67_09490 [Solirubrobacteraceae bacterium]
MPQIIVTAHGQPQSHGREVTFTERVTARDFESKHFQAQLIERIGWAVDDAQVLEQRAAATEPDSEFDASRAAPEEADRQRRSASVLTTAS